MRGRRTRPVWGLVLGGAILPGCTEVDIAFFADTVGSISESSGSTTADDVPLPSCTPLLTWQTDFSVDPTTQDRNGDGTNDWTIRNQNNPFEASEIVDNVWQAAANRELDTLPKHDFDTRTMIHVRMMAASGGRAQVWINFDHTANTYAALFGELEYTGTNKQNFLLYTKPGDFENTELVRKRGLEHAMLDVVLELDVDNDTVRSWVDGEYLGSETYVTRDISTGRDDRFASLVARDDTGQYDFVRVDVCEQ